MENHENKVSPRAVSLIKHAKLMWLSKC